MAHQLSLLGSKPTACEVELPILEGNRTKGVDRLDTLESKALLFPPVGNRDFKGNYIMSELGASFGGETTVLLESSFYRKGRQ